MLVADVTGKAMMNTIDSKVALKVLVGYFDTLGLTGYVGERQVMRLLLYLFLVDFVEHTYQFFTEEDHALISMLLRKLYMNGGCLLPYPVMCSNRATLGTNDYMGEFSLRVTEGKEEIDRIKRITEDDILRRF